MEGGQTDEPGRVMRALLLLTLNCEGESTDGCATGLM